MLDKIQARLSFSLQLALYMLGEEAGRLGYQSQKDACGALAAKIGDVKVALEIPAAQIFAKGCDEMHKRGDTEAVAELEALIKLLKGGQHRKVVGTFQYTPQTISQVDESLEAIRKNALAVVKG